MAVGYAPRDPIVNTILHLNATGFINKPCDVKELARVVRKVLDEAGPRRS